LNRDGDEEGNVGLADVGVSWESISHLDGGEFSVVGRVSRVFESDDLASDFNSETSELPSIVSIESIFIEVDFELQFNIGLVVDGEGSNGDQSIGSLEVIDYCSTWSFWADRRALVDFLLDDGKDSKSIGISRYISVTSRDGDGSIGNASPGSFSNGFIEPSDAIVLSRRDIYIVEQDVDGFSCIKDDLSEFGGDRSNRASNGDVEPVSSIIFSDGVDGDGSRDGSDQDIVDVDLISLLGVSSSSA
jgi:hypothetical protein